MLCTLVGVKRDFNPRSPWGERHHLVFINFAKILFQSTLSVRRATQHHFKAYPMFINFNPRSPWGERLYLILKCLKKIQISIHALREESDPKQIIKCITKPSFQSTLSVRRATQKMQKKFNSISNFNPRSPWGERQEKLKNLYMLILEFQSTLSVRRATFSFSCFWWNATYFNPRSPWGERQFCGLAENG